MDALKILAFVLIAVGAVINYGAGLIVKKLGLDQKMSVKEAEEFTGEELINYKKTKAIARVKVAGLLIMLPGVFMIIIAYK